MTNLLRVLCTEPYKYRPHEVGKLTPFQVRRVLLCERDKRGQVLLDFPADLEEHIETTLEEDFALHYRALGVTDPDAITRLTAAALAEEFAPFADEDE